MEPRLYEIAQEGLWIWALLVLGFVASYFLLAQGNARSLFIEILRSIRSFVESPFHYLRKTIAEICLGDANPRLKSIDHYLLRRLLTALQVSLLLTIFFGAGLAIASAVVAFLPPFELRQSLREDRVQLVETEASLKQDSDAAAKQNSDWNGRRDELIRQAQQVQQQKKSDVQAALNSDTSAVTSPAGLQLLNTLRNFLASRGSEYGAVDQAKSYVNRMPVTESETKALVAYCDHWQELQSLSSRAPKSLDQIRAEVQPDHASLVQKVSDETSEASRLRLLVKDAEDQVNNSYHPERLVLVIVVFLLVFILYVWAVGTGIEMFSMGLYLSNDVKQIRTQSERETSVY